MKLSFRPLLLNSALPAVIGGLAAWGVGPAMEIISSQEQGPASLVPVAYPSSNRTTAKAPPPPAGALWEERRRFCERLPGASLDQLQEMLMETRGFTDPVQQQMMRELIFEQMARTDAVAAWALLELLENGLYSSPFLQSWIRVDAAGAISWAEGQGKNRDGFLLMIASGLGPENAAALEKILPDLSTELLGKDQIAGVFCLLAAADPARAKRLFDGLPAGAGRNQAAGALAEGWAQQDANTAYTWAKDLTDPLQRESALRGVFRSWAEKDPQGVAAHLDELSKDPAVTQSAMGESPVRAVVRAWAQQDPKAATAWLRAHSAAAGSDFQKLFESEILTSRHEWKGQELSDLLRTPGEKPLPGQAGIFYSRSEQRSFGGVEEFVLGPFGSSDSPFANDSNMNAKMPLHIRDPARAFDELSRQPCDTTRQEVLHQIAMSWAAEDPQAALAKLQGTADASLKLSLINALTNYSWKTNDPALLAKVTAAFPPSESKQAQSFVSTMFEKMVHRDPGQARTLLEMDPDPQTQSALLAVLARQQALYDPAGALAWAAQQKDSQLQAATTTAAVNQWAGSDAYEASEWLSTQPASPLREAAVKGLVEAIQQDSPSDAVKWAASLTNPGERDSIQTAIIQNAVWENLPKAKQLAAESNLSDTARQQIQQAIEKREQQGF